jgi:hypothetical protein
MEKILFESLGVPEGILDTSEKIYDDFIGRFISSPVEDEGTKDYDFRANYSISDLQIKMFTVSVNITESKSPDDSEYEIVGYSTSHSAKYDNSKKSLKMMNDFSIAEITIRIYVPKDWSSDGVKSLLIKDKDEIINSFSHELMHIYHSYKYGYDNVRKRSDYSAYQNMYTGVPPVDRFMHLLYFVHATENVVRPSEFAMALRSGNVDQKTFIKFLKNNKTYQMLDEARNFSLESLKDSLKNYMTEIKNLETHMNHSMGDTEEEKIDDLIRLVYVNLINTKADSYLDLVVTNLREKIIGLSGQKEKDFQRYLRDIQKYRNNYEDFYRNEEKLFKFVANNMIKKISKLYAMTNPNNVSESIKNWDLYHKVNNTNKKLATDFKFKFK